MSDIPWLGEERESIRRLLANDGFFLPISTDRLLALIAIAEAAQDVAGAYEKTQGPDTLVGKMQLALEKARGVP